MHKVNETGQMATEPVIVVDNPTTAAVLSNEQEVELTAPGETVVTPEESGKKRSKIRLIAIVVALNVSFIEPSRLRC